MMTLKSASKKEALVLDLDRIQMFFLKWLHSPPFDIGNTTYTALSGIPESIDPFASYYHCLENTNESTSNGCLIRITPLAVWAYKLSKADLYLTVKLETAFTHTNGKVIEACYLYCYAISLMIKGGKTMKEVYQIVKDESERADIDNTSWPICDWFEMIEKN